MAPFGPTYTVQQREPWPVRAMLLLAAVLVLYWGRSILAPLALALLLTVAALPFAEWLESKGLPRWLSVSAVLAGLLAVILGLTGLIATQVVALAAELPRYETVLRQKLSLLSSETGSFDRLFRMLGRLGSVLDTPAAANQPVVRLASAPEAPFHTVMQAAQMVLAPVATLFVTLLLMGFLLAQREDARDRVLRLAGLQDMHRTTRAMGDATSRLGRYLLAQVAVNGAYGFVIGTGLWLIGLPNAPLWGALAFGLRFVPFIGTPLAVLFPLMLSLAIDPGWGSAMATGALFAVVAMITAYGLEPMVYRASIGIAPLAHVVSLAFWGLLWGPLGMVLAPALTAGLVILGRHVPGLGFLDVMLGAGEPLTTETRFYQRLLAGDARAAGRILALGGAHEGIETLVRPAIARIAAERGQEGFTPALATTAARTLLRVLDEASEDTGLPPVLLVLPAGGALDRAAAAGVALALTEAGYPVTDDPAACPRADATILVVASHATTHRLSRAMSQARGLSRRLVVYAATPDAEQALVASGLSGEVESPVAVSSISSLLAGIEAAMPSSTVTVTSTESPAKSSALPI